MGCRTEEGSQKFLKIASLFEGAMVDAGILLIKSWREVRPREQKRRLEARIDDDRKIWKRSPMDVRSYDR